MPGNWTTLHVMLLFFLIWLFLPYNIICEKQYRCYNNFVVVVAFLRSNNSENANRDRDNSRGRGPPSASPSPSLSGPSSMRKPASLTDQTASRPNDMQKRVPVMTFMYFLSRNLSILLIILHFHYILANPLGSTKFYCYVR